MLTISTSATSQTIPRKPQPDDDDGFPELLGAIVSRFKFVTMESPQLFRTDAPDLFALFLDTLPPALRQNYTCNCCRTFIERYGSLVAIDEHGKTIPAMWFASVAVPEQFRPMIVAMEKTVCSAKVLGPFLSSDQIWGTPTTGPWTHFAVRNVSIFRDQIRLNADQAMAAKMEDFGMLCRALADYSVEVVTKAHALLTTGQLDRSEKCIEVAKWFLALRLAVSGTKNPRNRENIVWRAVGSAGPGFTHVRSSMIGTLLDDIAAGTSFEDLKAKFDAKMHPLKYMRPTSAPSEQNIAVAEKIIADLRAAGSLGRRFARLADLSPIWVPAQAKIKPPIDGVFAHLKKAAKPASPTDVGNVMITWDKFKRTVLPTAETIEFHVDLFVRNNYAAFITAENPDAPPILKWDSPENRCPLSWYLYNGGSAGVDWNLTDGFVPVTAVALQPFDVGKFTNEAPFAMFILKGARDTRHWQSGGMFVESLRGEFHEIRKTMEAHFMSAPISGRDEAEACGLMIRSGQHLLNNRFRVVSNGIRSTYTIDRWD